MMKIVYKTSHFFLFFMALAMFLAFLFPSCAVNPVTGKQEMMLISEEEEIRLGRKTDEEIIKQYGLYDDLKLNRYLNEICNGLARVSHRPHLFYNVKVIDTSVVNAFAVPGGYIYFTRGILASLNSEAELAGVMGHEIGHITARHSAQQISKAQIAQIGLELGSIFVDSPLLTSLGAFGVEMLFLKFSRDNEREADSLAVEYASKIGYDASQLADFFETLNRMNPGSDRSGLPGWFSTHPSPQDRIPMIRMEAEKWHKRLYFKEYKTEKERYLRMIDGIVYGEDPRQGYVSDGIFYHPNMRFQFPVPNRWNIVNKPSQVEIVNESKNALIVFSISPGASANEAARLYVAKNRPNVMKSEATEVNGLSAFKLLSDVRTENGVLRIFSCFIEKNRKVFVFHGITTLKQFQNHIRTFETVAYGFRELTDPKRINVAPYRIRIRQVKATDRIEHILNSFGVPQDKIKENIMINSLNPGQIVPVNSLIKVIEKG